MSGSRIATNGGNILRIPSRNAQSTIAVGRTLGEIEDAQNGGVSGLIRSLVPRNSSVEGIDDIKKESYIAGVNGIASEISFLKWLKLGKVRKAFDPLRQEIAETAKWRGHELNKHAWDRHPRFS